MMEQHELNKFLEAQEGTYESALAEIKAGRKRGHWMWFIFPQIRGLGASETTRYYAMQDLAEAASYLRHPVLGARLMEICRELLHLTICDPNAVFGTPDDLKLRSSMTLFSAVPGADPVFQEVLDKFFGGEPDGNTLRLLGVK